MESSVAFLKYSIFSKRTELINLLLPVVFIVCVLTLPEPQQSFSAVSNFSIYFLSQFIFLNTLHVFFTVTMLFFVPELKKYVADKSKSMGRSVLKKWLKFYLAALIFFALLRYCQLYVTKSDLTSIVIYITTLFVSFYTFHHSISQSVGLSIAQYSSFLKNTNIKNELVNNAIKTERKLILLLLFLMIVLTTFVKIESEVVKLFTYYLSFLVLTSYVTWMLVKVYKIDTQLFKLKLLFSSRYFLFLLYFFNSIAIAATTAIHGFEYFIVTKQIMSKSKLSYTRKSLTIYIILATVFLFFTFRALQIQVDEIFFKKSPTPNFVDDLSFVFVMSLSFVHFFVDSYIYKMSDPAVKSNQGIFFNANTH